MASKWIFKDHMILIHQNYSIIPCINCYQLRRNMCRGESKGAKRIPMKVAEVWVHVAINKTKVISWISTVIY